MQRRRTGVGADACAEPCAQQQFAAVAYRKVGREKRKCKREEERKKEKKNKGPETKL